MEKVQFVSKINEKKVKKKLISHVKDIGNNQIFKTRNEMKYTLESQINSIKKNRKCSFIEEPLRLFNYMGVQS